ncbi:hypothetical protein NUW54_g950 [Trametes sanguinea]|uniref:Uncharacterized protein n=1 Tax=Trametes sanguinea TaxID=158606 RepID=A0ACC1QAG9_9APHY|nr:hypothetical protein NUW54_g950 [Trametes sanguinea]
MCAHLHSITRSLRSCIPLVTPYAISLALQDALPCLLSDGSRTKRVMQPAYMQGHVAYMYRCRMREAQDAALREDAIHRSLYVRASSVSASSPRAALQLNQQEAGDNEDRVKAYANKGVICNSNS